MTKRIYDVTYSVSEKLPVWPGDPPIAVERTAEISKGHPANLTRITMGSHTGTHVDAPAHFIDGGATVDRIPIGRFIGKARVVRVDGPSIRATEIRRLDLAGVTKVLFRTRNSRKLRRRRFDQGYVAVAPSGARRLVEKGIDLVGVDYLSVEPFANRRFETHKILLGAGVVVVEGLDLAKVPEGDYELLCFPLLLKGGDGAPARVVLREL